MRTASVVLLLLVALVLGFLVSVAVANELQTAVRDESTGSYNPNTPRDDALARGI
jgi:hypothetical protein